MCIYIYIYIFFYYRSLTKKSLDHTLLESSKTFELFFQRYVSLTILSFVYYFRQHHLVIYKFFPARLLCNIFSNRTIWSKDLVSKDTLFLSLYVADEFSSCTLPPVWSRDVTFALSRTRSEVVDGESTEVWEIARGPNKVCRKFRLSSISEHTQL